MPTAPLTPDHVARWEQRFARPGFMFGTAPNAFLAGQVHRLAPGARILVPGDGEGRNGVWLAGQGFEVVTVDLAASGVAKARALAAERGVALDARQGDLTRWIPPPPAFDAVSSIFLHLPPSERAAVHAMLWGALRPGGLFLIESFRAGQVDLQRTSPDGRGSGGPSDPAMLPGAAELRADLAGADWLLLEDTDTVLDEGAHHRGPAAVVRGVARRV